MFKARTSRIALSARIGVAAPLLILTACGGGDGSSPAPQTPLNSAPRITSSNLATVTENSTGGFYTVSGADSDGDPLSFQLQSINDGPQFTLSGTSLSFTEAPNFDLPTDGDRDNVYELTLGVTDGKGGAGSLNMSITVTNDKEGINVTRIATGLANPLNLDWTGEGEDLFAMEKDGRALIIDGSNGSIEEDLFISGSKQPGEVLAAVWGFKTSTDRYNRGAILITFRPDQGYALQAFDPQGRGSQYSVFSIDRQEPGPVKIVDQLDTVLFAIGDTAAGNAQVSGSATGKLYEITPTDPFAGASVLPSGTRRFGNRVIGDGIHAPGGFGLGNGMLSLSDQGSQFENSIYFFQSVWRPLDFGWPFYEGSQLTGTSAPGRINGPTLLYGIGEGFGEGEGPTEGFEYSGTALPGIDGHYVFGDKGGKIFSIPTTTLFDGFLHIGSELEDRSADFAPDVGTIDSVVAFARTDTGIYILDSDGEVFRVEQG